MAYGSLWFVKRGRKCLTLETASQFDMATRVNAHLKVEEKINLTGRILSNFWRDNGDDDGFAHCQRINILLRIVAAKQPKRDGIIIITNFP